VTCRAWAFAPTCGGPAAPFRAHRGTPRSRGSVRAADPVGAKHEPCAGGGHPDRVHQGLAVAGSELCDRTPVPFAWSVDEPCICEPAGPPPD